MICRDFCFESEDVHLTVNAQPAILTVSTAAHRVLSSEKDIRPDFVAGHSLGEYSALVASGSLDFEDAIWAVRKRGEYTQESCSTWSRGDGGCFRTT